MHGFIVSHDYVKRLCLSDIIDQTQTYSYCRVYFRRGRGARKGTTMRKGRGRKGEVNLPLLFLLEKRGKKRE